ncbi:NADH-quinone oxidoreductase subunit C [Actinoplanes sp. TRM 88003]|uniref:NADH-quinone oxidoreductase n=1 Tax=Paractinoplanes aksuensis TaxID=2939490 RepID=A0ABT1E1D9_9ACTN|nr:NADH-quinone oxidoreductase subunit C [Actinoplanes aksuensis]
MTPEEVGERLVALLTDDSPDAPPGEIVAGLSGGGAGHERAVVDVPVARWWETVGTAKHNGALGCDYFDWLSAVDELDDGFRVVAHLYSTRRRHALLLRTLVPRDNPVIESVIELFPGAAWHERETYEMFGITFARHPDLRPLLLPPGFEGHPLRKEFVLASRVAKAWPGAKEPGESEAGTAKRAPMRPPGVPDPNEWGPKAGQAPPAPARPPRPAAATDRPRRPATPRPATAQPRSTSPSSAPTTSQPGAASPPAQADSPPPAQADPPPVTQPPTQSDSSAPAQAGPPSSAQTDPPPTRPSGPAPATGEEQDGSGAPRAEGGD